MEIARGFAVDAVLQFARHWRPADRGYDPDSLDGRVARSTDGCRSCTDFSRKSVGVACIRACTDLNVTFSCDWSHRPDSPGGSYRSVRFRRDSKASSMNNCKGRCSLELVPKQEARRGFEVSQSRRMVSFVLIFFTSSMNNLTPRSRRSKMVSTHLAFFCAPRVWCDRLFAARRERGQGS